MKDMALVITGMGAVTPIGIGVPAYGANLVNGTCGIGPVTRFDASGLPVRIDAEIQDFDPSVLLPRTVARSTSPLYAVCLCGGGRSPVRRRS